MECLRRETVGLRPPSRAVPRAGPPPDAPGPAGRLETYTTQPLAFLGGAPVAVALFCIFVLLIHVLGPALVKATGLRGEARIVNHSSFARNGPPGTKLTAENCRMYLGKNGGDLGGDGSSMICGGARWVRYAYTKLANVAFTLALHDKLGDSNVKALCAAPGLVATQLQATTARDGGMGSGTWFMRWSQSPEDGAVPLLHCCLSSAVSSGELYEPKGMTGPPVLKDPLEKVCLEADRAALWAASEAAVGEWDLDL